MYSDAIKKFEFHKQNIIHTLLRNGMYPDESVIAQQLKNLDLKLAIFKHKQAIPGEKFDVKEYNQELLSIHNDLAILYKLLYELSILELNALRDFSYTHLNELQTRTKAIELKAKQEIESTTLGKTLLFKHSDFNVATNNNETVIDCGSVKVRPFSKIACLCDIDNVQQNNIICELSKGGEVVRLSPYNLNRETVLIKGKPKKQVYTSNVNKDLIINGPIELQLNDNHQVKNENTYLLFGGNNKVMVKEYTNSNTSIVKDMPTEINTTSLEHDGIIEFYVINGNKITFWFNEKPVNANFPLNNYVINNLNYIHRFYIEAKAGFAFKFTIDNGLVYAVKSSPILQNNKIYYTDDLNIRDFYVEEYSEADEEEYELKIRVFNNEERIPIVNSVTLKELSFGEVI